MRDFNFKDDSDSSAANIADVRPQEAPPEILRLDETPREEPSSLRPFHAEQDEEESNNLSKIVGAAVVGLLISGGGIYAYESTVTRQTPAKTVAMKTPSAPTSMASTPSQPATPDSSTVPPTATPPAKSASETPAPKSEPVERSASSAPTPGVGIGPANDPAINAPMTYTADNAPPPQQPGTSGQTAQASQPAQTAMQQPITTPNIGNTSQPTAAVANNQPSGVTMVSGNTSAASQPASAPTEQVTPQPAQQPAQVQPAQIQPAQPAV